MSESPAPANAGRYPELPSAAMRAILAAQYGCIPDGDGLPVSLNAPPIVDRHHDIEAPGACFPATPSLPFQAILAAQYGCVVENDGPIETPKTPEIVVSK